MALIPLRIGPGTGEECQERTRWGVRTKALEEARDHLLRDFGEAVFLLCVVLVPGLGVPNLRVATGPDNGEVPVETRVRTKQRGECDPVLLVWHL